MAAAGPKGRFTIRFAAALFVLSALFELFSITTEVPWFGVLRGGAPIVAYHLIWTTLFLAMGVGLWAGTRWGYWTVIGATVLYTLDKARYLLDRQGRAAEILYQLQNYPDVIDVLDMNVLLRLSTLMTIVFVLCWWGFAGYIHVRMRTAEWRTKKEER